MNVSGLSAGQARKVRTENRCALMGSETSHGQRGHFRAGRGTGPKNPRRGTGVQSGADIIPGTAENDGN